MKDLKGKKGANLIVKILAMVLMPMLVIIFLLGISQVQVSRLEKKILREMREMAG